MSQDTLASVLGISTVHTNRTLQSLRARGLVDHEDFELVIHDFNRLAELGLFDAGYLDAA